MVITATRRYDELCKFNMFIIRMVKNSRPILSDSVNKFFSFSIENTVVRLRFDHLQLKILCLEIS